MWCVFCFVFQLGVKFRQCLFRLYVYHISIYIPSDPISFTEIRQPTPSPSATLPPFIFAILIMICCVNAFFPFASFCFLHFMADFNFFFARLVVVAFSVRSFVSRHVCVCVHGIQTSFRFQQLHSGQFAFMHIHPVQLSFVFRSA